MAEWVRALACTGDRTVRDGLESHCGQLRFGTLAIPFPSPCGGDTKNRRSLLSGVYARGSKRSHQSALECVGGLTVVDSTTHFKKTPHLQSAIMRLKTLPCTCIGRRRRDFAWIANLPDCGMAHCNLCVTDFSISSGGRTGGRTGGRRHQETARHAKLAKSRPLLAL